MNTIRKPYVHLKVLSIDLKGRISEMAIIKVEHIRSVSKNILLCKGVPEKQADIIADTIVDAHVKEKHTHGLGRLSIYSRKIDSRQMTVDTKLEKIREYPVITVLDAHHGFGQVAGYYGMEICAEKAQKYGVGIVGVKDSNSFGAAGYYGEIAAKKNLIGIVMGNASKALAPEGGKTAILGTNPICFSFPGTDKYPAIVLDMACSVAARSKVRIAAKNGNKIPVTWAKDSNGKPTEDPLEALKGSMCSFGGYKGFGIAMAVDILAGLLTGSAYADEVKALNTPFGFSRYGHFLCAINPEFFIDYEEYILRIEHFIESIKACGDPGNIFMPGEHAYLNAKKNKDSVYVTDSIVQEVNQLADTLDVNRLN